MRVALYWTPELGDPLGEAGNIWLGRDPESGAMLPQPPILCIESATAPPRVYGFHATLRPPMRLATGWEEFMQAAHAVAGSVAPFDLPPLAVQDYEGFIALRETTPCPALHNLADTCVRLTDPHRQRPGPAELARRRGPGLTAEQDALLLRWGYPQVMEHWSFHMTLTGRLAPARMERLLPAAGAHFASSLRRTRQVRELAVFTQCEEGGVFLIAERLTLHK